MDCCRDTRGVGLSAGSSDERSEAHPAFSMTTCLNVSTPLSHGSARTRSAEVIRHVILVYLSSHIDVLEDTLATDVSV
jgi:hypothetical protein